MSTIDLNADLGEGIGKDAILMPFLSSCNIACGGHAGNQETIRETILLANKFNVKIGAHPSFPDRENFGREELKLTETELHTSITQQIKLVQSVGESEGTLLHHVKPHGALYNLAAIREDIASTLVNSLLTFPDVSVYAPYGSTLAALAKAKGIQVHFEIFADRNYNNDLTLVSRKHIHALLHDPNHIAEHVIRMIKNGEVKTLDGKLVQIEADTVCIHGDNPNAEEIIKTLRARLKDAGIEVS